MKRRTLDELEVIAAKATRQALEPYVIPDKIRKNLVRGIAFEGDERVFELYVPGERPEDAVVISEARINAIDGSVINVQVFNLERKI